jgi:anti-sigma regulatory factor (Ser/Thr protein kinase)
VTSSRPPEPSDTDARAPGAPSVRPDHLVVWLRGVGVDADPPVVLDDELAAPDFAVSEWMARVRAGYPEASACIVHDPAEPTELWAAQLDQLVRAFRDGDARFTGDTLPARPARLRRWVRSTLEQQAVAADGDAPRVSVDDVVLVVDELVTNAGEHAEGWVTVDLVPRTDGVVVAVSDPSTDTPAVFRSAEPWDESGRGLLVVSALSPQWGVLVAPTMKTVWSWLPAPGPIRQPMGRT